MKQFIEVTKSNGEKYVVNVQSIGYVHLLKTGNAEIIFNDGSHVLTPQETYEEIKALIQEAL